MDQAPHNMQTSLHISEEVVSMVANKAILELDGVAELANLPVRASVFAPPSAARPIKIELNADVAQIDIGLVVHWNYRLKDVCEQVQTAVKDAVQNMTGVTVSKVNVYVAGVRFGAE